MRLGAAIAMQPGLHGAVDGLGSLPGMPQQIAGGILDACVGGLGARW